MKNLEFVIEQKIGETKDSELQNIVKQNFKGETAEAGMYFAMARLAERQGYPEIAEALRTIGIEEIEHASRFAQLNGMISEDIFENIRVMLDGETNANKGKREAAIKAEELGIVSARDYFNESAKDEARHARILEGLLNRFAK
ncbi:ferritin family protein [Sporosalibacterium faouarense]|uniref:ferritin family protein n=1 Tax=Sporosalibacterium faouarense TaxID=516123 RepID=UPI00141C7078|nr:rubrerythrin family protein [Bacillota bacterium]